MRHCAIANDEFAVLEDQRGGAEHFGTVGIVFVDGDIRDGAGTEMAAIRKPRSLAGAARVIVAISTNEYSRVIDGSVVIAIAAAGSFAIHCGAQISAHQQRENLRIGREWCAVRMIGREEHAPRIFNQQKQL